MENIILEWKLIPSWKALDNDQNRELIQNNGGIYLKIWRQTGEIIYIGETGRFINRLQQHFKLHLSGGYTTCDYKKMSPGQSVYDFWKENMYGKDPEEFKNNGGHYPDNSFTSYLQDGVLEKVRYFTQNISLAFACIPEKQFDKTMRKKIESYLQMQIWKKTSLALGEKYSDFETMCKIKVQRGSSPFGKIENPKILENCSFVVTHCGDSKIGNQFS